MTQINLPKIVMIILAIVIIAILVQAFFEKAKREREANIHDLKKKLKFIEDRIAKDVEDLRVQTDLRNVLDRKARNRFFFFKMGLSILVIITLLLVFQGQNVSDTLSYISSMTELAWVPLSLVSCLLVNKMLDTNSLFEWAKLTIQVRVYKEHGFDPTKAELITSGIEVKKNEAQKVRLELDYQEAQQLQQI